MASRASEGRSLVHQAVQSVRDHIKANDLKVGDTLPGEGHFAGALGVSRAVIREAFGALAALHLIDVGNGRRARVGAIDGSVMATSLDHAVATAQVSIAEVWDVRRTLELRTAELAANARSDADARDIVRFADGIANAGDDLRARIENDLAFHAAIARASGNMLFLQIVRAFAPMMEIAIPAAWHTRTAEAERERIARLHQDLAAAIADRDSASARTLMDVHFDASIRDQLVAS
jgi:GntR family transcriptional regulator, transcriptional repressor for pyruvate dehydrogenase complex